MAHQRMGRRKQWNTHPYFMHGLVLMSGAKRPPAIVNATAMIAIGLGPAFHWPILMLAGLLGTAVNIMLR